MTTFYILYENNIRGKLIFCCNKYENEGTIIYIDIDSEFRGLGMGTYLLLILYNYVIENHKNIKYIVLDDCSDNYRCINNIYLNVGAKYVSDNGPEMIWKINRPKKIKDKYKKYQVIIKYN